jgi:hypothetical protein
VLGIEEVQSNISDATGTGPNAMEGNEKGVSPRNATDFRKSEPRQNLDISYDSFELVIAGGEMHRRKN